MHIRIVCLVPLTDEFVYAWPALPWKGKHPFTHLFWPPATFLPPLLLFSSSVFPLNDCVSLLSRRPWVCFEAAQCLCVCMWKSEGIPFVLVTCALLNLALKSSKSIGYNKKRNSELIHLLKKFFVSTDPKGSVCFGGVCVFEGAWLSQHNATTVCSRWDRQRMNWSQSGIFNTQIFGCGKKKWGSSSFRFLTPSHKEVINHSGVLCIKRVWMQWRVCVFLRVCVCMTSPLCGASSPLV